VSQAAVYAVADDQEFVDAVAVHLHGFDPIAVRLQADMCRLRAGDSLVVIGVWSRAAAAAGIQDLLAGALAAEPRRAILCRLENAPPFPLHLDPQIVELGPAPADALLPALESAVSLARKRGLNDRDDEGAARRGTNGWILAALMSIVVLGLGGAGVSMWLSPPPKPIVTYAAPTPPVETAAVAQTPPKPPESPPAKRVAPEDPTRLPPNPFARAPAQPLPPAQERDDAEPSSPTSQHAPSAPAPSPPGPSEEKS